MALKLCLVGCGWVSQAMHVPAYKKYGKVELAACCGTNAERTENFRREYGFARGYIDMDTMLDAEEPDVVCLNTPVAFNAPYAERILERGIPLVLEKPPGRTVDEVKRLIAVAERTQTPHRVAFNRRYAPMLTKLREMIKGTEIQSLQYDMFRIKRTEADFSPTAIHAIDAVRHILGTNYKEIRFTYSGYDIFMNCVMENGIIVNVSICPNTGVNIERIKVNSLGNNYFLDLMGNELNPEGRLIHISDGKIVCDIKDEGERFEREGFYAENATFFDAILRGKKPIDELATTLQSVEVQQYMSERRAVYM
jgi:predicted dehydrogenase